MKYREKKVNNLYQQIENEKIRRDFVYPMRKLQNASLKQDRGQTGRQRAHARVSVRCKQTYYYGSKQEQEVAPICSTTVTCTCIILPLLSLYASMNGTTTAGSMILAHVIVVLCWSLVCFLCPNPTSELNRTSTSCSAQPVSGRINVISFSLCCHTELATRRRIAKRVKATLPQRTERRDRGKSTTAASSRKKQ